MKEKMASILLICLVALSIIYVCNSTALSSHELQAIGTAPSRPTSITETPSPKGRLSYPAPIPMGDPIDNPIPHKN